ncbi:MAG: hypothetical protein VX288_04175, partial [Planctomycetota bacterium]|nr:hypothetical protein [Planctomycetota bacterium]
MAIQSAQKKPRGGSRTAQKTSKLLVGLWPSEVRAIQACQSFLRREQQGEVSLQETLEIWEGRISRKWRAEKMKIDGQMQLREIEQHQSRIQEKEGRTLDWETAAQDWIERHASSWREWWEEQPASCPNPVVCSGKPRPL